MNIHSLRAAALSIGNDFHLLDHIAPLASLLSMPLITPNEKIFRLAKMYYPSVTAEYQENLEFKLSMLAERFDTLFQCQYWMPPLKDLFLEIHKKEMQLVFCPHGQSDKGKNSPILSLYAEQDAVLVYGKLLIEMLKDLKIWPSISKHAVIGNYRLNYYLQNQDFYDTLAEKEIFSHLKKQSTLLYAPTWQDKDKSSSFFYGAPQLFSELPSHWNLIIKVHPRLEENDPARLYQLLQLAEKKSNVCIITEFPPIYPILSKVDAYIGDLSSVGYDFLFFQRPMFFFPHLTLTQARLQSCGHILPKNLNVFSFIEKNMDAHFKTQQQILYQLAFGILKKEGQIKDAIFKMVRSK